MIHHLLAVTTAPAGEATRTAIDITDPAALWQRYQPEILGWGFKVAGALAVIIIGLWLAGWISGTVRKQVMKRDSIDDTLGNFFASIIRWAIVAAVFIAALQVFGVQATSFVAVLGALTLALGLSMQGALGNLASGVMIMLFRPYRLGDYVEIAGVAGTVKDINMFQTILATIDNIKIMVPNSQAIDGVITNYSGYDRRRIDIVFGIDYDDDMDKAMAIIEGVIMADPRVMKDPAPFIKVTNLGDSSVDITTRSWAMAADFWDTKFDLTKKVKQALDAGGISIPYPHTTLVQKVAAQ